MNEKDKSVPIRYLHPENELFVAGKTPLLADPDEVKHNIRSQIETKEVLSTSAIGLLIFMLPPISCMLCLSVISLFTWISLKTSALTDNPDFMLIIALLFGLFFFISLYILGQTLYDYVRYIRPMRLDTIYVLFKWDSLICGEVSFITPISDSYVHIFYGYRGGKGRSIGNYLATPPLDLAVGDFVYIARAKGTKIIL